MIGTPARWLLAVQLPLILWPLTAGSATAQSASPQVDRVLPRGGQRGTEVTLELRGRRLADAQGLFLFRPGLEVIEVESEKSAVVRARVRIADDCALGAHPLRLRTARGISRLHTFHVGTMPEVFETDASNSVAGQEVELDSTVNGEISQEDVDRYAVEIPTAAHVTFEVEAVRLGGRALDLVLEVVDAAGEAVLTVDDTPLGRKDPIASATFATAGRYQVVVRQAMPIPANVGPYRLHVGTFPRPTGALPCGGRPGEELEVSLLGDPRLTKATVVLPDDGRQIFEYFPRLGSGATSPTPILLRVGEHEALTPTRPADTPEGGKPAEQRPLVSFPGAVHGVLGKPGQRDRYYFKARRGQRIAFRAVARALRSPVDPLLVVRYENGRYVASNDDANHPDSFLRFTAPADGVFCIELRDVLGDGSPAHFYRIEGGGSAPPLSARMVVDRRSEAVLPVPRGARMAGLLQCSNVDYAAGPQLAIENLPAGVSAELGPLVRGSSVVPVVLAAAADAPLGGDLATFAATAEKQPEKRPIAYEQVVDLVRVRNNRPFLQRRLTSLPVAVAETPPFRLELEQPTVPLVRGGPQVLQVRVTRADGFKGTVRLRMLWNPPGLSSGQVNVAGDKDSGRLPVNASTSAQVGTFKVAVVGYVTVQGGKLEVSTGFADLQVEKPWVTAQLGRARAEPGQSTELKVQLSRQHDFQARFQAQLVGLPRGVTTETPEVDQDCKEIVFPLKLDAKSPPGRHRSLRLRLKIPVGDSYVVHDFRGGELRIDRPRANPAGAGQPEKE